MVSKENKSSIRHEMSIKGGYGQKCRKTDRKLETDRKKIVHFYGSFGKMCIEKLWCPNIFFFFQNKNHNYTPYIMVSNKNSFSKLTKCPERKMGAITKESFFPFLFLFIRKFYTWFEPFSGSRKEVSKGKLNSIYHYYLHEFFIQDSRTFAT